MQRSAPRGFTLTEAALSMALVGIIALAAIVLYAAVTRTFMTTRKSAMLTGRAQAAVDYLIHDFRNIGGNGIPASAAIFVEDAAGGRGGGDGYPSGRDSQAAAELRPEIQGRADRVTTFVALPEVPRCPVQDVVEGAPGTGTARFPLASGVCCFTTGSTRPFIRTMILMKGENYRPVMVTNRSGTCEFKWQDIVPPQMRFVPSTGTVGEAFNGGQAVLVDFRTIYLDPITHDLVMHLDKMSDPEASLNGLGQQPVVLNERLRVLDGVYDFQVSLGYDLNDSGDVSETPGGASDEWLHNAPNETTLTNFNPRFLKLVRLEAVVGLKTGGALAGNEVSSPARTATVIKIPQHSLRVVGTRFSPRNLDFAIDTAASGGGGGGR